MRTRVRQFLSPFWKPDWLLGVLLIVAVCLAYRPAWHGGFIWDDDAYVTTNPLLSAPDGLRRIWFSLDSPSQYFPLTYTVFRLQYALWGLDSTGYHWVNLLFHAANALLLQRLLRRLNVPGAWLAAGIFALHPVHVESVAWITELKNVLSLFFCLMSLLQWLRCIEEPPGRAWRAYLLALLLYILALLSKTTSCTLPAALLLMLWLKKLPITWLRLAQIVPFLFLGLGAGLLAMWWERYHQGTQGGEFTLGLMERLLIASRAIWVYAAKLLWPANLIFGYPRWNIDPANPLAYAGVAASIGLGVVILLIRQRVGRGVEAAVLFYVATLGPVLGFVMYYTLRYTFVMDHYQYMASVGPIALVGAGLVKLFGRWSRRRSLPVLVPSLFLLGVLGALTWRQCGKYTNLETLWRTTLAQDPGSWLARNNLGMLLFARGQEDEALEHFRRAVESCPAGVEGSGNLGFALLRKGEVDQAIVHLQRARELQPDNVKVCSNLGDAFLRKGRLSESIESFQKAIALQPTNTEAHNSLGVALLRSGHLAEAAAQFRKALELCPDHAEASHNLGVISLSEGKTDEAITWFQSALQIRSGYATAPGHLGEILLREGRVDEAFTLSQRITGNSSALAETHYYLGMVFGLQGRLDDAVEQYEKAIGLKPDYVEAHGNLAKVLATQGRLDEAVAHYRQTLELKPDSLQGHYRLGEVLQSQGNFAAASKEYQLTLKLDPRHWPALTNLAWLLATCPEASVRDGVRALDLAQQADRLFGGTNVPVLGLLAAAHAETGQFDEAVATARTAVVLATAQTNAALVSDLKTYLDLYRAKLPLRIRPQTNDAAGPAVR